MNDVIYDGSLLNDDELIRAGFNLIPQAISIFDAGLRLRVWNTSFVEMFELPETIVYRGAFLENIFRYLAVRGEYGPGDVAEHIHTRMEMARAFQPVYLERSRPDGAVISIEGFPIKQGGWVTVYTDITAQKRQQSLIEERSDNLSERLVEHSAMLQDANRELSASNRMLEELKRDLTKSENRMREITQALPAHIAYLTKDYVYTFSNERFGDITGHEHPKVEGKSLAEVFGADSFNEIEPFFKQALSGEQSVIEFDYPPDSESPQIIRTTFTPERDEDNNIKGVFLFSINITEEKEAVEAQIQSKRMETTVQLTTGLAHDFGNILTVILGNLKHIDSDAIDRDARHELIQASQKSAQRAVGIIEKLMSFTGKRRLAPKYINIPQLLSDLEKLFTPSLPSDVRLSLDISDYSLTAFVDESALQDVILNLLLNAKDAVEEEGKIFLTARKMEADGDRPEQILISVTDDGCGIEEEALKKAFEPFYTTKQERGGSGLGLSMAQGFARQSGGKIRINSRLGEGTTVNLSLPCRSVENNQPSE